MARLPVLLLTSSLLVCRVLAGILVHPISVNVSLNSTVTFSCEAEANDKIYFYGNDVFAGENSVMNKGFTQGDQVTVNATTVQRNLTVDAREGNNNTNITCRISPGDIVSNIALLRIQGPLASVGNLSATVLNGGSSVQLTWAAPYTLDSVPISGYSINGQLVNANEAILYSNNTPVDPCTLNTAVVTAINGAGEGQSANISYYYQTVPQDNPPVSIAPSVSKEYKQVSLQVNVMVDGLCPGEYPSNATVCIMDTNGGIQLSTSLPVTANGQLMDNTPIAVPDNFTAFIVNVSLSNRGGVFPTVPSFPFGFLGPVLNISSSVVNCSAISISWDRPAVDEIVPILHYTLRIYDAVNGVLVRNVSYIEGTSYQFEDHELFRHLYIFVIAAVNELGEGESANGTFSFYQRAPQLPKDDSVQTIQSPDHAFAVEFIIPVALECTGGDPENVTVTVQCGGKIAFNKTYLVKYVLEPHSITGCVQLRGSQCTLSIVFSNRAGHSDQLILPLKVSPAPSPSGSAGTKVSHVLKVAVAVVAAVVATVVSAILLSVVITIIIKKRKEKRKRKSVPVPTDRPHHDVSITVPPQGNAVPEMKQDSSRTDDSFLTWSSTDVSDTIGDDQPDSFVPPSLLLGERSHPPGAHEMVHHEKDSRCSTNDSSL